MSRDSRETMIRMMWDQKVLMMRSLSQDALLQQRRRGRRMGMGLVSLWFWRSSWLLIRSSFSFSLSISITRSIEHFLPQDMEKIYNEFWIVISGNRREREREMVFSQVQDTEIKKYGMGCKPTVDGGRNWSEIQSERFLFFVLTLPLKNQEVKDNNPYAQHTRDVFMMMMFFDWIYHLIIMMSRRIMMRRKRLLMFMLLLPFFLTTISLPVLSSFPSSLCSLPFVRVS